MEISGKITRILPEKSGTSARGQWRKQEYILETQDQYPKPICFMVWGDKIDDFGIQVGQELQVSIDIESREYNDRWYTDVKAWKVARAGAGSDGGNAPPQQDEFDPAPGDNNGQNADDIPF